MFHWQGQQCHDSQTCGEWTRDQCLFCWTLWSGLQIIELLIGCWMLWSKLGINASLGSGFWIIEHLVCLTLWSRLQIIDDLLGCWTLWSRLSGLMDLVERTLNFWIISLGCWALWSSIELLGCWMLWSGLQSTRHLLDSENMYNMRDMRLKRDDVPEDELCKKKQWMLRSGCQKVGFLGDDGKAQNI